MIKLIDHYIKHKSVIFYQHIYIKSGYDLHNNVYTMSVPLYLPMSINAPVDYSQISTLGNINYIIREAVQFVNAWNLIFFVFIKNLLMLIYYYV